MALIRRSIHQLESDTNITRAEVQVTQITDTAGKQSHNTHETVHPKNAINPLRKVPDTKRIRQLL